MWLILLVVAVLAFFPGGTHAGEISFFGNAIQEMGTADRSYGWQLDYAQRQSDHFKYSLSYLNEGHATTNHRDGVAAQVWACPIVIGDQFKIEAGVGPYYYFDTHNGSSRVEDIHGWGGITTLSSTFFTDQRLFFQVRMNWIATREGDTLSTGLGIGYHLDHPVPYTKDNDHPAPAIAAKNEVTFFFGDTIVNNPDRSGHYSYAQSLEYRRSLNRNIEWTAGWLHENKNHLIDRNGVVSQLWVVNSCFDNRVALGFGLGPYFAVDRMRERNNEKLFASGVATLTSTYRFESHWDARLSWSRIITDYDRDSDLIMLGLGRRF